MKDLAAELDMSVQAVSYHVDNLQDAGLIEVLDMCYSEKGREMSIYGPSTEPYILFLGTTDDQSGLTAAFKRFANAIGPVGIIVAIGAALSRLVDRE
ncbi:ArsR family transcriptional regulator [Halorubrum californiense DSM 19288]|uniref:ArsR family transcriptional regulator n=1 Tax=Halorubrum californiense DSM 19288 TaxID=1227465 RepID=M0E6K3_9EURY|nr:ArsR family transcriptional regulator [Halorubrum californiense DSM 19288]